MLASLRMKFTLRAAFGITLLASFVMAETCRGQVRINEILGDPGFDWNGDGMVQFKEDEWIEIVNAGATPVDLAGFRISDGANALRYGFTGVLAPGQVRIVYGSDSVVWEAANALGSAGLSLNNSGDTVSLWEVVGTDTMLVDTYTYVSHEVLDDRATGRMPDGGSEWRVFDGRNPYPGTTPPLGTGCHPTPAASNSCPTPVAPSTWTSVKARYVPAPARADHHLRP